MSVPAAVRITVNFHPDRVLGGRTVMQALADDGIYRTQFETGTSNGGLTAHPGGDRWRWESKLFDGRYDLADAQHRPRYGALNRHGWPFGAAPRFGSSAVVLRSDVLTRTTCCWPDSAFGPRLVGPASSFDLSLVDDLDHVPATLDDESRTALMTDPLNDYVEAHVHGVVSMSRDVDHVVLDPSFRGTDVEQAAAQLPCEVRWHDGFRCAPRDLVGHEDYRGPEFVALAQAVCATFDAAELTPAVIGHAVAEGFSDSQDLKRVWHLLARFGSPVSWPPRGQRAT